MGGISSFFSWCVPTETHVQSPVQFILGIPMRADILLILTGLVPQAWNIIAVSALRWPVGVFKFLDTFNFNDLVYVFPFVVLISNEQKLGYDAIFPGLYPSVPHIDIGMYLQMFRESELIHYFFQELFLIFLYRQNIIGFIFNDLFGDVRLCPHGIDGYDVLLNHQFVQ